MENLSIKEKIVYRFILNENRVYKHWYSRFLICGVTLARIKRVVSQINNFYVWCNEWSREGKKLEHLAEDALSKGNTYTARFLFHEAAGCFHIGQHIYFINIEQKNEAQEKARHNYRRAIELYDEEQRPIRIEIPFQGTVIPGYLRLTSQSDKPLIIHINGLDNIKEIENHYLGNYIVDAGFCFFTFDGPGQGEMWKNMKMIPDYEKAVSAVIDWFEKNNEHNINLERIGISGWSFGGYLSPRVAAYDKRICCAVGNGGIGYLNKEIANRLNLIWVRDVMHVFGFKNIEEYKAAEWGRVDIKEAPPMDRPLLIIHAGKDTVVPNPKEQVDYIMDWAIGEKELKYYPDGEHCCINYLDEVIPYSIDWLRRHLLK